MAFAHLFMTINVPCMLKWYYSIFTKKWIKNIRGKQTPKSKRLPVISSRVAAYLPVVHIQLYFCTEKGCSFMVVIFL